MALPILPGLGVKIAEKLWHENFFLSLLAPRIHFIGPIATYAFTFDSQTISCNSASNSLVNVT